MPRKKKPENWAKERHAHYNAYHPETELRLSTGTFCLLLDTIMDLQKRVSELEKLAKTPPVIDLSNIQVSEDDLKKIQEHYTNVKVNGVPVWERDIKVSK